MRKIVCIGESILSPLGATPAENFAAVCRGESALQRYEGMFGVREPFVASLMDRSLWTAPGRTFFDSIVIEAARRAIEAAGIDPASPRTAFVLSTIKGNIEFIDTFLDSINDKRNDKIDKVRIITLKDTVDGITSRTMKASEAVEAREYYNLELR